MKECPKCGTTYTDGSLSYCLADGSVLTELGEQQTVVRPAQDRSEAQPEQFQVDVAADPRQNGIVTPQHPAATGSNILKIVLLVGLVLAMFIGAAALAGALIYFNKDSRPIPTNSPGRANHATPSPTGVPSNSGTAANSETERLQQQIANLQKRLDEQETSGRQPSIVPAAPDQPSITSGSARVASTGDGFLALRSLPSSDMGERLLQIPNGARVAVAGCLPRTRVGNKTGRWCRATYNGYSGWVFDAWLIY